MDRYARFEETLRQDPDLAEAFDLSHQISLAPSTNRDRRLAAAAATQPDLRPPGQASAA